MDYKLLIEKAREASLNTYSPYSHFPVGAALLTKDNKIYKGANIENASFGLTNCAERSCLFSAYTDGVRKQDIIALAIYTPTQKLTAPCGACRQVMVELLEEDCKIILANENGKVEEYSVKELMPLAFTSEDL